MGCARGCRGVAVSAASGQTEVCLNARAHVHAHTHARTHTHMLQHSITGGGVTRLLTATRTQTRTHTHARTYTRTRTLQRSITDGGVTWLLTVCGRSLERLELYWNPNISDATLYALAAVRYTHDVSLQPVACVACAHPHERMRSHPAHTRTCTRTHTRAPPDGAQPAAPEPVWRPAGHGCRRRRDRGRVPAPDGAGPDAVRPWQCSIE